MRRIPSVISLLRAVSVIPIWVLFPQHPTAALFVFMAAAASDFLDGFLARSMNAESEAGKTIDPLADKILYLGSLLVLRNAVPMFWLLFIPAFVFEGLLIWQRLQKSCAERAANFYGKLKTTAQFCAIALMMFGVATNIAFPIALGLAFGIIAIPLAWFSFYKHIYSDICPDKK